MKAALTAAAVFTCLGAGLAVSPASAAILNFDDASQYTNNFRTLEQEMGVTIGHNAGGFVRAAAPTTTSRVTTLYDTTPGDLADTKTTFGTNTRIEFDARLPDAGRSIGVYLINAASAQNAAYLALFNVDDSGTSDRIRFSSSANPTSAANNAAGLEAAAAGNLGNAGYNASTADFVHVTLDYTVDVNSHPVLSFTAGDFNRTITFASLTAYSQVEVAFRLSPGTSGSRFLDIDNVSIGAIPEPAALSVFGLGAIGLLSRRRRE